MRWFTLAMWLLIVRTSFGAEPKIDHEYFEKKVRPLLVERCQKCHTATKSKGGLDLSTKAGFLKGGDTGPMLDKNKPEASKFLEVLRYDSDVKMPQNGKLPEAEIAVFTRWIQAGAPWPDDGATSHEIAKPFNAKELAARHWAFQPMRGTRRGIDDLIRQRLQDAGLRPAVPADPEKLLRRAYFDIIGLPPTQDELRSFRMADYESTVDRLLASPHFGERWGRHWLDLVRYAETRGHEFDFEIPDAWRYRDYVVRAFNDNLPYDRFVKEQVAGDCLPPRLHPRERWNEALIATGFWHLGEAIHSPVDVRQNEADRIDNMIDVFGKTFLGLTLACARCHDHKFDPIPTADYYSLYGILGSSRYGHELIEDPAAMDATLRELRELRKLAPPQPIETIPAATEDFSGNWASRWFLHGPAFRTVGYPHSGRESRNLRGTLRSPTFTIEKRFLAVRVAGKNAQLRLILNHLQLIQDPIYGGLRRVVDHGEEFRWIVFDLKMWPGQTCYLELIDDGPGYAAVRELRLSDSPPAEMPKELCDPVPTIPNDGGRIAELETKIAGFNRRAIAMVEGTGMNEQIFIRGNPKTLGARVERRFLEVFREADTKSPPTGSGRLQLAEALTDPSNPLVARVFVNRVWQHYFGVGLVPTPDDFGKLGQEPTHLELLDTLATDFVRDGWNIRNLHRRILLSQTYRQSAMPHPDTATKAATIDPQNKLLHRANVKRLEAEAIRDAMLVVSGRLDRTIGGPGILPHLTEFTIGRGRPGGNGPVDGQRRRSLYLQVRRNFINPFFSAFDYPTPFTTIGRRSVSNVPAQALAILNNPFVLGEAEHWSRAILREPEAKRIETMFWQAFGRRVTEEERSAAMTFVQNQTQSVGELRAWAELGHALFNAKEFVFIE